MFTKQGIMLKKFISLKLAALQANQSCQPHVIDNIRKCLNGNLKSAYDYLWSYNTQIKPYSNKTNRNVAKYSLDGGLLETFNSIVDAANSVNETDKNLWGALNRQEVKQLAGFMWRYYDDTPLLSIPRYLDLIPFKIVQYNLQNEIVNEFSSIQEASNKTNISRTRISMVCNGHAESVKGYKWKKIYNQGELE